MGPILELELRRLDNRLKAVTDGLCEQECPARF